MSKGEVFLEYISMNQEKRNKIQKEKNAAEDKKQIEAIQEGNQQ